MLPIIRITSAKVRVTAGDRDSPSSNSHDASDAIFICQGRSFAHSYAEGMSELINHRQQEPEEVELSIRRTSRPIIGQSADIRAMTEFEFLPPEDHAKMARRPPALDTAQVLI